MSQRMASQPLENENLSFIMFKSKKEHTFNHFHPATAAKLYKAKMKRMEI